MTVTMAPADHVKGVRCQSYNGSTGKASRADATAEAAQDFIARPAHRRGRHPPGVSLEPRYGSRRPSG